MILSIIYALINVMAEIYGGNTKYMRKYMAEIYVLINHLKHMASSY